MMSISLSQIVIDGTECFGRLGARNVFLRHQISIRTEETPESNHAKASPALKKHLADCCHLERIDEGFPQKMSGYIDVYRENVFLCMAQTGPLDMMRKEHKNCLAMETGYGEHVSLSAMSEIHFPCAHQHSLGQQVRGLRFGDSRSPRRR
jgi:hypothetical protein